MSRFTRPRIRAKAAIRERNKPAGSFFLLSAENTAVYSIRIKLAILAIPTDLLATQQLLQWFSGDVHKNEMDLCHKKKKIPYIKVDAAVERLPSPDSTPSEYIFVFCAVYSCNH